MRFFFDDKALQGHPCVSKVDRFKLVLNTDLRVQMYKVWRENQSPSVIAQMLHKWIGTGAGWPRLPYDSGKCFSNEWISILLQGRDCVKTRLQGRKSVVALWKIYQSR